MCHLLEQLYERNCSLKDFALFPITGSFVRMAGTSRAGSLSRMTQSLRGERVGSFTVEREKELQEAFFKACSEVECPPKEKHVRTITIR